MTHCRTTARLLVVLAAAALAKGCGDADSPSAPPPDPARPTTITVTPATADLAALGATVQLTAEVRDQNGNAMAGASVSWASSASAVATVSAAGLVTATGNGTATVTATSGSASGSAAVTVAQEVAAAAVTPSADTLVAGDTLRLAAEVHDANGHPVAGAEIAWASGDTAVARVDSAGLVTGISAGEATVTAVSGSVAGEARLTVVENPDRAALVALYNATDGPNWLNNDNWLTDAPLGEWYGVSTDASGSVVRIGLGGRWDGDARRYGRHGLTGSIPSELGRLANLEGLNLSNNRLTGPIPTELADLANLETLSLWNNELTGPIPAELGNLSKLDALYLSINRLTGPIPAELANLANLEILYLGSNELTGPIPAELGQFANLETLVLSANELTGPIPSELGNLANLTLLGLTHNKLTGPIPPELGNLANLKNLALGGNSLSGPIPPELGNLTELTELWIYDTERVSGPIPPELGNLANLTLLILWGNNLSGPIPPELGALTQLQEMQLSDNNLSGPIPPELGNLANLTVLSLGNNSLTGPIPPELGNLSALKILGLGNNNLTGEFPAFLLKLPALERLFLGRAFCAPADPAIRARIAELAGTDLFPCPDARVLPSALMREDGNGMSLALPDDLLTASTVTVSDPSVVDATVADGWLKLTPRGLGSTEVKVRQAAGRDSAVAHVGVREAVGTFGIDILVEQPVPLGLVRAMVEAADWWSYILDGTEWPDREAGCPIWDPFGGKVKALADELLVAFRTEEDLDVAGYASGCFFPVGEGRGVPALDPGGGYVVTGVAPNQGLLRHEIGHLLGLVSWRSEHGLATSDCQFFTGRRAVEAFRAGGGDPDLPGVPIQTGCGSHWHRDVVGYELMGPFGGWDANSISLGALVDAGYTVDLSKALPWPWRAGAAAQAAGEGFARDVVLGEPRVFIERRPREPPR